MPIYEYKCKVCDDRFEIEQSFTDDALTTLEGCEQTEDGEHQLKKVFSAVGISFKGDGFYRNDSRSSGSSKSDRSESGGSDGKDSPSSESTSSTSESSTSSDTSSSSKSTTKTDSGSSKGSSTTPSKAGSSTD